MFLGTTGGGKSSTCNFIVGKDYFPTGHSMTSMTSQISHLIDEKLGVKIIDTPGFGDTALNEKNIDQII